MPSTVEDKLDQQASFDQRFRQLYAHEAGHYDQVRFKNTKGHLFDLEEQMRIHALLGLRRGQTLLDVAAGTGRIAVYLAEQQLRVTALDLTPNMLRKAQARAAATAAAIRHINFVEGNGRLLPFPGGLFDGVISIRFLHLLPVSLHRPFILEMWRMVRPGGVLLVEFDNALAGLGAVTWGRELYRRLVLGHKPRHYVWPHQIAPLFADIPNISLHGFWFFGAHVWRRVHPPSERSVERLSADGGRSFLANRIFVRAVKAAA